MEFLSARNPFCKSKKKGGEKSEFGCFFLNKEMLIKSYQYFYPIKYKKDKL